MENQVVLENDTINFMELLPMEREDRSETVQEMGTRESDADAFVAQKKKEVF